LNIQSYVEKADRTDGEARMPKAGSSARLCKVYVSNAARKKGGKIAWGGRRTRFGTGLPR